MKLQCIYCRGFKSFSKSKTIPCGVMVVNEIVRCVECNRKLGTTSELNSYLEMEDFNARRSPRCNSSR